jgi:hypothetical protein
MKFSVFHRRFQHRLPLLSAILLLGCSATPQPVQSTIVTSTPAAEPTLNASVEPKLEAKPDAKSEIKPDVLNPSAQSTIDRITLTAKTAQFIWRKPDSDPKSTSRSEVRRATLRYPTVTGVDDPALQTKIQSSIDLQSAFGKSLAEMESEFQENHWMEKMDYEANYNNNGLLSLTYSGYGVGAYPSSFVRYRSVNLRTGEVLRLHDLFKTEALGAIALMVDRQLQQAIQTKVAELDNEASAKDIDRAIFRAHRFRIKHLNEFTITPEGVIFHYRFGFPHVILAAEPKSDYLISHAELKSYLKANSPLIGLTDAR